VTADDAWMEGALFRVRSGSLWRLLVLHDGVAFIVREGRAAVRDYTPFVGPDTITTIIVQEEQALVVGMAAGRMLVTTGELPLVLWLCGGTTVLEFVPVVPSRAAPSLFYRLGREATNSMRTAPVDVDGSG